MPSGFSIIIAGNSFDPERFLKSAPLPELPWEMKVPSPGHKDENPALELYDLLPGPYPLGLEAEFCRFLENFRDEVLRALNAPGVVSRNLNLYDEEKSGMVEFSFTNQQLRELLDFGWDVSFAGLNVAEIWSAGSRILRR